MAAVNSRQRLKAVDQAYRATLKSLHDDFNKAYDAALRKHGLTVTSLMDHFSFPLAFHADIAEAKKAHLAGRALALQARHSSVREMPRKRRA